MSCEHRFTPYPESLKLFCSRCGFAVDPFSGEPATESVSPPEQRVRRRQRVRRSPVPDPVAAAEAELARIVAEQARAREQALLNRVDENLDDFADEVTNATRDGVAIVEPRQQRVADFGERLGGAAGL